MPLARSIKAWPIALAIIENSNIPRDCPLNADLEAWHPERYHFEMTNNPTQIQVTD